MEKKSQEFHFSACIQLRIFKHTPQKSNKQTLSCGTRVTFERV